MERKFVYKGKEVNLSQLSELSGISMTTLSTRLKKGWDVNKAVETPVDKTYVSGGDKKNKTTAEWWLNDNPCPKSLLSHISPHSKKTGEYLRKNKPDVFNKWYNEEYLKQ